VTKMLSSTAASKSFTTSTVSIVQRPFRCCRRAKVGQSCLGISSVAGYEQPEQVMAACFLDGAWLGAPGSFSTRQGLACPARADGGRRLLGNSMPWPVM
jgi:hypothetical protein